MLPLRRLLARILDLILSQLLCVAFAFACIPLGGIVPENIQQACAAAAPMLFVIFGAVFVAFLDAYRGRTFGKQLLGIEVRLQGASIKGRYKESFLRNVPVPIPFLNLIDALWIFYEGGRIGDKIAHTSVVRTTK